MGRDARKQDLAGRRRRPVIRSRRPAAMIGIGLVSIAAAGAAIGGAASAAVPAFPNNLVVFPNRDFVTVEGYQDHIGETALLKVTRGRTGHRLGRGGRRGGRRRVRGQPPRRRLLGRRHEPAGHARHQGRATRSRISFDGQLAGDTTVQDAAVDATPTLSAAHADRQGPPRDGVSTHQLEQRVVNPDLTGTDVARRDVRALPGPLDAGRQGRLLVEHDVHRQRVHRDVRVRRPAATAAIAANGGGERMMSWELAGRRRQPPGPHHRRVRRAGRPRDGRMPGRSGRRGRAQARHGVRRALLGQDRGAGHLGAGHRGSPARRP